MSFTSYPIIINKSHYVGDSTYVYSFGSSIDMANKSVALEKATIWYSFPNITAAKNNNSFSVIHPTSTGTTTINFTLPDGGYNISDIDNYMRWYLINQGYYIQNNSTLEQVVYCKLAVNPSTYQIQFISYPLPTSLPTGFTAGSAITFPATAKGPQLVVANNAFQTIIGFAPGTFPAVAPTTITTVGSTVVPVVNDVQNIVITLDSCFNRFSATNSRVIHSLSIAGAAYASLITSEPKSLSFIPQQSGSRTELTIQLCDQYLRPLNLLDSDATIILQLRNDVQAPI